jgi:enediyne biosynthesis protein E4
VRFVFEPPPHRSIERQRSTGYRVRTPDLLPSVSRAPELTPALFERIPLDAPRSWRTDYYVTGQAFGDYDGDGWLDLYLTDSAGPNRLFRNNRRGGFELAEDAGDVSLPDAISGGAVFADYDNDGDQDLLVLSLGPSTLFEFDGGVFVDVTEAAGIGRETKGETASFGDYDGDGFLDLFIASWLCYERECRVSSREHSQSRLFHNEGDGTFTDASNVLGLELLTGLGFVASFLDYDDDGDLDLYLVNDKGYPGEPLPDRPMNRNLLWRNDGSGCSGWCFTEVAIELGADARIDGMGLAVGDYDEDGDLDLYLSNTGRSVLYRNDGGAFTDVAAPAGVVAEATGWGTEFLDYDADGDLDLYLAVGRVFGFDNPNRLFENVGGTFIDVSANSGADDPRYSIGVATADFDRDGGIDLVVGDWDVGYRLLRNRRLHAGGWLSVRLVGSGPINKNAIGARATAHLSDGRTLMREVRCGSSLGSGSDVALYFGTGAATVESLEIRWPDGTRETRTIEETDAEVIVTYGE